MAIPKNRNAVMEILKWLEPQIIGKKREGFQCGPVKCNDATAVSVEPGGNLYPGQETCWASWRVHLAYDTENPVSGGGWSCGISEFVDTEEIERVFTQHFGVKPSRYNSYRLKLRGAERVHAKKRAAVRIVETSTQIRFCFDWGKEQTIAEAISKLGRYGRLPSGYENYNSVVSLLQKLQTESYMGGPEPELPFEPRWHTDYAEVLKSAAMIANHIFMQNIMTSSDHRGTVIGSSDVVFMKVPIKD